MSSVNSRLGNDFQNYIHLSKYSRFDWEKGRRETWAETVTRWVTFMKKTVRELETSTLAEDELDELFATIESAITNQEVMPSMRGLMTAGPALERDHTAIYNCAYRPVDSINSFDEAMYLLLCGCGVGFSVERQYVSKLPQVPDELFPSDTTIVFSDSKIGWARGYRELMTLLYAGQLPKFDLTKIRERGAILKTFGGRASGPEPLKELLDFTVVIFKRARGRRLNSIECHDLMCKVGDAVVSGGVRRSAMISLSNLSDDRMRHAKSGDWWKESGHRALANNSVAYTEVPEMGAFMAEWRALYDSKSGERGIIYRQALKDTIARSNEFRKGLAESTGLTSIRFRDLDYEWGCNPCSEIILRPEEFCNLSETIVRPGLSLAELKRRVRIAALIGTVQSIFTKFRYVSSRWRKNVEDERLLGVSLTGILSHEILSGRGDRKKLREWLTEMRREAILTNVELAEKLGIPSATAVTCVKPSGTVSSLNGTPAGIHPEWSDYYVRTVREDKTSPIARMFRAQGVPVEDDVRKREYVDVFSFPVKAPEGSFTRKDLTAVEHLELWKEYQLHWCDHKPSITVNVREHEWMAVGAWVYENFDIMSGVSFLPYSEHTYEQAPYQEITKEEYDDLVSKMPAIEWGDLSYYENEDMTTGSQELACSGADGCSVL